MVARMYRLQRLAWEACNKWNEMKLRGLMSEPRSASVKNARLRTSSTIAYLAEGTCGGQGLECAHNWYALVSTCVPVVGPCVVYGFWGGSRRWHLREVIRWCGIRLSTCACCALEVYSILVVIVARLVCADLCCFSSTCCWFVLERFGEACCRFVALERGRYRNPLVYRCVWLRFEVRDISCPGKAMLVLPCLYMFVIFWGVIGWEVSGRC